MRSDERRHAIVEAAIHLFAEKGFRGATTRELASALGVTEPVLYQHFKTKRDLYRAIIETKAKERRLKIEERVGPYLEAEDDRGFFQCLAELLLERYEQDPEFVRLLLFSALEGHELAKLFYERQVIDFYLMLIGYIKRRIRQGGFTKVDPNVAARAFVGMVSHHGMIQMLFQDKVVRSSRKKLIEDMVNTFLEGAAIRR